AIYGMSYLSNSKGHKIWCPNKESPHRRYLIRSSGKHESPHEQQCRHYGINVGGEYEPLSREEIGQHARGIFNTAINAVLPSQMVHDALQVKDGVLSVKEQTYELKKNVHISAFGKAVIGMVRSAESVLGDEIVQGIASVPFNIQNVLREAGKSDLLPLDNSKVKICEGAKNNIPDEAAQTTAMAIYHQAQQVTADDILLVLVSGGGSALLPSPIPPITLNEMAETTRVMGKAGATIQELNTVRKQLEILKGGGLARAAFPAKVVTLILSDVIGDPLDLIASGPTVEDPSTAAQCLGLFQKLNVHEDIPNTVKNFLQEKLDKSQCDKDSDVGFDHVQNVLVGTNNIAIDAASSRAIQLGYLPFVLSTSLAGDASEAGVLYGKLAEFVYLSFACGKKSDSNRVLCQLEMDIVQRGVEKAKLNQLLDTCHKAQAYGKGVCIISGGETTVDVKGSGKGGRNQELALSAAMQLRHSFQDLDILKHYGIQFLSGGTDGQDGPTEAAGATADPELIREAEVQGFNPQKYLDQNDTFTFYSAVNGGANLVTTGLTGTNVMDIQILLVNCFDQMDKGSF
ncbi:unnamed protein product, partial [Owenia fusiformis]